MRSFALIALFLFSAQVQADIGDGSGSGSGSGSGDAGDGTSVTDKLADKLIEKLVDKLLGKVAPAQAMSPYAKGLSKMTPSYCMQAYSPYDAKKYETLSYLPQLSNEQIRKQISYMITNNWSPALEFSDDGDIYLNTRMGPCYYDNRYWSMYKLPMFGCTNPDDVLNEIQNAAREYPQAKVRVMAYDPIKQVQVAGFIVRK